MEDTKQDIQDATSNYLVKTPTPDTNILDTTDATIQYTEAFLQPHHYYPEPTTNPISQFYSPTTQIHLTTDTGAEASDATAAIDTESTSKMSSPKPPL